MVLPTRYSVEQEEGSRLDLMPTYLSLVEGSIDSEMFNRLYVLQYGYDSVDVINDGDLACAFYVSFLLSGLGLSTAGIHTTVDGLVYDLEQTGWIKVQSPVAGSIVVWSEKMGDDGSVHKHIGICLDEVSAVSNCPLKRSPQKQGIHDMFDHNGQQRPIEAFYVMPPSLVV